MENTNENKKEKDLAENSFIHKWPSWLRWILVIPSAIIGGLLIHGVYALSNIIFSPYGEETFWIEFAKTIIFSCSFIYSGVWMAPSRQYMVSIILLIFLSIISLFNMLLVQEWQTIITSTVTIVSGVFIVIELKKHD